MFEVRYTFEKSYAQCQCVIAARCGDSVLRVPGVQIERLGLSKHRQILFRNLLIGFIYAINYYL